MSLQVSRINHNSLLLVVLARQPRQHLSKDALLTPPLPTIVECSLIAALSSVGGVLSVRGHGSLRGRIERLMMVFGGGSSPMSCAGYGTWPPHALQRDRSTSVPSGLRSPLQTRELRSGGGLLCTLKVGSIFPERQHKHGDLSGRRDRRLAKAAPSDQSHSPAFQLRETFYLVDHG